MASSRDAFDRATRLTHAGLSLRLGAAIGEVSDRFRAGGVDALLLKGASIAQWLYDDRERRFSLDCDLLIAPAALGAGETILESLGYDRHFDDRTMPSWWREHASAWVRERDGLTLDLHRTLQGVGVDDTLAWRVLWGHRDVLPLAGRQIPTLDLPARALNLALHAAHHGASWPRPLAELERGLARADEELWRQAAALAQDLDAVEAFAAGLRLTEAGTQLATRLELPLPSSVEAALHASTPPPVALGFEQLASAPSARARIAIVWHKLVPPAAFIRHWDPRAKDSRRALVRAYLRRPVWLARNAPEGFRAWRRARRTVRR